MSRCQVFAKVVFCHHLNPKVQLRSPNCPPSTAQLLKSSWDEAEALIKKKKMTTAPSGNNLENKSTWSVHKSLSFVHNEIETDSIHARVSTWANYKLSQCVWTERSSKFLSNRVGNVLTKFSFDKTVFIKPDPSILDLWALLKCGPRLFLTIVCVVHVQYLRWQIWFDVLFLKINEDSCS